MALCELDAREAHIWQMLKWYRSVDATPEEIRRIAFKACRPLVITLYANPQAPGKESVVGHERKVFYAKYHNLGEFAIAIVAVVNYHDGRLLDWAAYIGGTTDTRDERAAIDEAAKHGNKLSEKEAKFYFSGLPPMAYRP